MTIDIIGVSKFNGGRYPVDIAVTQYTHEVDGKLVVYGLSDPRSSEIFYVGKTNQIVRRMKQHCRVYGLSLKTSAVDKRKLEIASERLAPGCVILHVCGSELEMDEMEQRYIDLYKHSALNVQKSKWKKVRRYE